MDRRLRDRGAYRAATSSVLAADVTSYSRLMGLDEVGTFAALKQHRRELVDPAIAEHGGRIVKTTGDGILIEFASAVDTVTFAVTVQADAFFRPHLAMTPLRFANPSPRSAG